MKLTQEEQQLIQAHRIGADSQKSVEVDNFRNVRGNLHSALDNVLVSARRSPNADVKAQADAVYKELASKGYNSIADAPELSQGQYNQLIQMSKDASSVDESISFDLVKDTAILFDSGVTDEMMLEDAKNFAESQRNTNKPESWDLIINNVTGTKMQVNSSTGDIRPFQDAEADGIDVSSDNDIAFQEYVMQGGKAEDFGTSFHGMSDLETR